MSNDASYWHWKFCKECSYDDLFNEALGLFDEVKRLKHQLLDKDEEILQLKRLNNFFEQQVEEQDAEQ